MRFVWAIIILGAASAASAAPPEYASDPFNDADFIDPPLILEQAHPTAGRFEVALMYSASAVDKYNNHNGALLDVTYNFPFLDTLGVGLSFAYYHGSLTNIVTGGGGILGNKVSNCSLNAPCQLDPNVPDYKQLTSSLSFNVVWSPLYGKISLVSEVDLNLQLYVLAGGGIVGRREITATFDPSSPTNYRLTGGDFGDGALFNDLTGHGMAGVGVRIFIFDWLNIRADFRALVYPDEFDFDEDGILDSYPSFAYMAQVGLGFVPFGGGE